MTIRCPNCGAAIGPDDVNVPRDEALCPSCEQSCYLGENVDADLPMGDLGDPPEGAWYEETIDGFVVGATTRSVAAIVLVPFIFVWSAGSLRLIYGRWIAEGPFGLFQWSFVILFELLTFAFLLVVLMTVAGRVVVSVSGDEGQIFTGLGPVGIRKRFSWSGVDSVVNAIDTSQDYESSNTIQIGSSSQIRIRGADPITFGGFLSEARRRFMIGILRRGIRHRGSKPPKVRPDDLFGL